MTDEDNKDRPDTPATKEGDSQEKKENGSPLEPEILGKLSPEIRRVFESFVAYSGPIPNPLFKKITEAHIDKVLDLSEKDSERDYEDAKSTRKYGLVYVIIILIFLGAMTVFLVNADKELYKQVLNALLPFLAGLAGGYGLKAYQDRDRQ